MEAIPEVTDSDLILTVRKRYHGGFELDVSYAGLPMCRYPLLIVTDRFLWYLIKHFPVLGLWIFSKEKRNETLRNAYSKAITDFVASLKMDVATSIFEQGE